MLLKKLKHYNVQRKENHKNQSIDYLYGEVVFLSLLWLIDV